MPDPTPVSPTPAIDCHAQAQIDAQLPHPDKKKIFVFCDGTGNEFADGTAAKGANSNVVKLYTALRVTNAQTAYYHPGVGTMGNPAIRWRLPRFWSKVKGLAFGSGFRDNVLDAYRYLMGAYNDGDEIYIFGFSRGAYTARALAGMLHGYGLLCPGNEGHMLYAWNMFHRAVKKQRGRLKRPPGQRGGRSAHTIEHDSAFAQTFSRSVTVRFMGIWDTVSSVGWIYKPLRLLDMAQNPIIRVGRHAVSIDERRAFYRDNLWGDSVLVSGTNTMQDIAQVWFPGAHSDVGGSYPQTEAAPANEALRWMIGELQNHGAELCQERVDMVLGTPSGVYSADKIYTPPPKPDHCLHQSLTLGWWPLQLIPQQHYDKEDGQIQWRVPYNRPRTIPRQAIIHGSAVRRLDQTTTGEKPYRPLNLQRNWLHPVTAPLPATTANLAGCYVYEPQSTLPSPDNNFTRKAKVFLGRITFVLFLLLVAAIAWYVLCGFVLLALAVLALVTHTPTCCHVLRRAFQWIFCHLP